MKYNFLSLSMNDWRHGESPTADDEIRAVVDWYFFTEKIKCDWNTLRVMQCVWWGPYVFNGFFLASVIHCREKKIHEEERSGRA